MQSKFQEICKEKFGFSKKSDEEIYHAFGNIGSFDFGIGHGGRKHVRNQIGCLMYSIHLLIRIKSN